MNAETKNLGGRPPSEQWRWDLAVDLFRHGEANWKEVASKTGLGRTKVYEARRWVKAESAKDGAA
jgi:hypothetical protein